jgi:hypothetical protein
MFKKSATERSRSGNTLIYSSGLFANANEISSTPLNHLFTHPQMII